MCVALRYALSWFGSVFHIHVMRATGKNFKKNKEKSCALKKKQIKSCRKKEYRILERLLEKYQEK